MPFKMNDEYFDCKMLTCSNNVESSIVAVSKPGAHLLIRQTDIP